MPLYGEIFRQPELRFDYSSSYAKDKYSKRGLLNYGPYDSNLFGKEKIKSVIIYPSDNEDQKETLVDGLIKGEGTFRGFRSFFKTPLKVIEEIKFSNLKEVLLIIDTISAQEPDIVFVVLQKKDSQVYKLAKSRLLANGIPSQMVTVESLTKPGRQYTLENLALASYAKVGGTPWTISTSEDENNLILGISRAIDISRKHLVGFVTLFTNDGDFVFMNSKAPVIEWDDYVTGLSSLIEDSIIEYEREKGTPDSIIVHLHKKPGKREIESIELALNSVAKDIPYALVHLNEYSNFRLFDSSHPSYIPPKGLFVRLSSYEGLLLNDGRIGEERRKIGMPRVLNIRMDKRSTIQTGEFNKIAMQVYEFSYINWRGFNAESIPITLNYSKLIAKMVVEIGIDNWNQITASGKLRDKSWFL
ncbi:MAG: hypothetical protein J7K36_08860 [Archaeoglobaceae archaeon]|nr:hypothetical protein [Archaeoglobaceae archaeon]